MTTQKRNSQTAVTANERIIQNRNITDTNTTEDTKIIKQIKQTAIANYIFRMDRNPTIRVSVFLQICQC